MFLLLIGANDFRELHNISVTTGERTPGAQVVHQSSLASKLTVLRWTKDG